MVTFVQVSLQTEKHYFRINSAFHSRYRYTQKFVSTSFFHSRCRHRCSLQFRRVRIADQTYFGHNVYFIADADTENYYFRSVSAMILDKGYSGEGKWGVQSTGVSQSVRATSRDESQLVPSPEKLIKTRDLELPSFEGSLPSCSPHSAGYTCTFLHPYFPVGKVCAPSIWHWFNIDSISISRFDAISMPQERARRIRGWGLGALCPINPLTTLWFWTTGMCALLFCFGTSGRGAGGQQIQDLARRGHEANAGSGAQTEALRGARESGHQCGTTSTRGPKTRTVSTRWRGGGQKVRGVPRNQGIKRFCRENYFFAIWPPLYGIFKGHIFCEIGGSGGRKFVSRCSKSITHN